MAELFLAEVSGAHGFAKTIVIKRLLPHLAADPHFNAMFVDEAKLTARLVHPKIAQTYELGRYDDQLYIAMELVDGLDALSLLRECAHRRSRVPPHIAVYIAHEVLDALDFAHNQLDTEGRPMNIVHRDISPSNVLLSRRGDVKLVDFGIARAAEREHLTQAGTLKGKYGYMAPEQVLEGQVDNRSDLFAVGIVLAELLTGRRLFAAANELDVLLMVRDARLDRLDKYGGDLNPELAQLLRRSLRKNADERFQSAAEMRDELGEWLFHNRHRVTPRHIADIVETLYEDAWTRRKQGLSESDARAEELKQVVQSLGSAQSQGVAQATAGELVAAPRPGVRGQIEGIPAGEGASDSMPLISIETADDPEESDEDAPTPVMTRPRAGTERPRNATESGSIVVDLSDTRAGQRSGVFSMSRKGEPVPEQVTSSGSARYASIEAAVTSLSQHVPDPSTVDFDDKRVGSGKRPVVQRPLNISLEDQPTPPPLEPVSGEPDDRGDFTSTPSIAVLYRLAVTRATGLLVVSVGAIRKEIFVRDGVPEFVTSNVAHELFGEYLVSRGVISAGELAMALAMMPHYSGKLGDTLVGLGLMKPLDVFRQLTRQVRHKLIDVCTWTKGSFSWYGGRENQRDAFPLDLNAFEVLGAGAMALPAAVIDGWTRARLDARPRSDKTAGLRPEEFELGPDIRDIWNGLDGSRTLAELSDRFTAESQRQRFLRILYLFAQTKLVQLVG